MLKANLTDWLAMNYLYLDILLVVRLIGNENKRSVFLKKICTTYFKSSFYDPIKRIGIRSQKPKSNINM